MFYIPAIGRREPFYADGLTPPLQEIANRSNIALGRGFRDVEFLHDLAPRGRLSGFVLLPSEVGQDFGLRSLGSCFAFLVGSFEAVEYFLGFWVSLVGPFAFGAGGAASASEGA